MKNIIILLFAFLALNSCQKEFKVDNSGYKPKLVVNNLFLQNTPFAIVVSQSVNVYDSTLPSYISNATVTLFVNNVFAETLTPAGTGNYNATTIPSPGNTYKVKVSQSGFDAVEAENALPNPVKIIDWTYIDSTSVDSKGDYYGDLTFTIVDPPEENNYLLSFQFYDIGSGQYIYLSNFSSNDQSLNQNLAKRLQNGEYLFTDNLFNAKKKTFLLSIPSGHYTNTPNYLLKLYSLSKDAYFYYYSQPVNNNVGQFNTTPIYSNVKSGLGIFAGRSLDVDTIQ
jgi:hypothetical protein